MSAALATFDFHGRALSVYTFNGRPCWIAQDVGEALGYTRDGWRAAIGNWGDELLDGQDVETLRGQKLRQFKALLDVRVSLTLSRTPNLTILYETGLNVVCLKTEKPLGKKLRRFLADVVMPGLTRGTLDQSAAEQELIALTLRLNPGDVDTIWETETVQQLCAIHGKPWDGAGAMPFWLQNPMGRIYKIVLGDAVYRELKARNPDPKSGSLNYQFLTEARARLMRNDMGTVSALLRLNRTAEEFFEQLAAAYKRKPVQYQFNNRSN